MHRKLIVALVLSCLLATPAAALNYPVSGPYGESSETRPGPIDCRGRRVIEFDGARRFNNFGGVPDFRVIDLMPQGGGIRITEEFHTGQIRARNRFVLRELGADRIQLALERGGTLILKRCA